MQVDSVVGYGYIIKNKDVPISAKSIQNSPYFYRICERCGESEYFLGYVIFKCNSKERYRYMNLNLETYNSITNKIDNIKKIYKEIIRKNPKDDPSFVLFTQLTKTNS